MFSSASELTKTRSVVYRLAVLWALYSLLLNHDVKVGFVQKVCRSAPNFVTTCLCSSTKQVGEKLLSELVKNTDVADGKKEEEEVEGKEDSEINAF